MGTICSLLVPRKALPVVMWYLPHQVNFVMGTVLHSKKLLKSKEVQRFTRLESGNAVLASILGLMILSRLVPSRIALLSLKPPSPKANHLTTTLSTVCAFGKQLRLVENELYAPKQVCSREESVTANMNMHKNWQNSPNRNRSNTKKKI